MAVNWKTTTYKFIWTYGAGFILKATKNRENIKLFLKKYKNRHAFLEFMWQFFLSSTSSHFRTRSSKHPKKSPKPFSCHYHSFFKTFFLSYSCFKFRLLVLRTKDWNFFGKFFLFFIFRVYEIYVILSWIYSIFQCLD